MPTEDPLDYASRVTKSRAAGRSAFMWTKLFVVWALGLVSWTLYLLAIFYLWLRFLA